MAKTQSNNPQTTNPNNPSTTGNAGNQGGIPENLSNIEPNPQTADNANTAPQNNNPPAQQLNQVNPTNNTNSNQKPPIKAISFKSKFLEIKITDPNILEEVNTEGKYATNLPFEGLFISINQKGGRHYIKTQDRKEVDREIVSGVHRNEVEGLEFFETDRSQ